MRPLRVQRSGGRSRGTRYADGRDARSHERPLASGGMSGRNPRRTPASRSVAVLIVSALMGAFAVVAGTIPGAPSAFAIPGQGSLFDCSGGTIYQVQRTNGTLGILNTVAVGSMSGTNSVTATQVNAALPDNQPNALGIAPGGTAAWVIDPQQPQVF